ncbi:HupE/UreJ family protein [Neptunomonas antarctica]|uniref:HupE/UreJ family protein n=1 Tax=Neptunomonas antarctica TaxID=619304 RepID=UPI0006C78675
MFFTPIIFTRVILLLCACGFSATLFAHGVDDSTKQFLLANQGVSIIPYLYIGAKHMITGYDHLLFLVGVIFFLYRSKDVMVYVTLFTIGHSTTLMFGVLYDVSANAYLIDAIIGFSIIYKGFDNLGGFKRIFGFQPNTKAAVMIFGLFHGFGLATKIQEFNIPQEGLIQNLIAFNVGVELGQISALILVLLVLSFWRKHPSFLRFSTATNALLMSAGVMLVGFQLTGYFTAI